MAAWTGCFNTSIKGAQDVASLQCLEPLFANVVRAVVALSAVALFIMLLVAGYTFLFSAGDQKKLAAARGTMTNAIIGLVVIVIAYLIVRILEIFLGVSLSTFQIPK